MKTAAKKVRSGDLTGAVNDIFSYHQNDAEFKNIYAHFSAKKSDIATIITGIMASGAGGEAGGHYIPVSTVLFRDTFAYMLRAQNGQVEKAKAYFLVNEYFRRGDIVFGPEREFH